MACSRRHLLGELCKAVVKRSPIRGAGLGWRGDLQFQVPWKDNRTCAKQAPPVVSTCISSLRGEQIYDTADAHHND